MPTGDLDGWSQIFTEDFGADVALGDFPETVAVRWSAYPSPWHDTSDMGTYSPRRVVSVNGGVLTKHIHTEDDVPMVAAILPALTRPQLYGRYSICWRSDRLPGYKIAWLLWPDSDDMPADGELDLPEMDLDTAQMAGYVHRVGGTQVTQGFVYVSVDINAWHVTTIEWSPDLVVFIHDGAEIYRTTEGVPATPMHWVIQTEVASHLEQPPDPAVAGDVQIGWVTVYAYDPDARAPVPPRFCKLVAPAVAVGAVELGVTASAGLREAKWMIDGREVGWAGTAPYTHTWHSDDVLNGIYPIFAKTLDARGWVNSETRSITVANTLVSFTPPATATGRITLAATVPSPWVRQIKFVLDGREIGSRSAAPWSMLWDTTNVPNGEHVLFVKTLDDDWVNDTWHRVTVTN